MTDRHDNAWRTRGVCQTVDPETFFPVPMAPADVAIGLCGSCPVAGACLAWALSVGDCHGVWGATTARERRAMLVAWRTEEQAEELGFAEMMPQTEVIVSAGELVPRRREPQVRTGQAQVHACEPQVHTGQLREDAPLLNRERARVPAC